MPKDRFFLETDGADVDIRAIYQKVATDRSQNVDVLKSDILNNYKAFFEYNP